MKWMGLLICLCIAMCDSNAQTTAEWLQQKKTRIRYLLQQVAALQVYTADVKKGYRTVKDGLNVINDIKHGDFDLHHNYFNSLSSVGPNVKGYSKVQGIADLQSKIILMSKAMRKLFASPFLCLSDQGYLTLTLNELLQRCSEDMDKLTIIMTSGEAGMTEEGRLKQINVLYESARDKYSFVVHLKESVQSLLRSRANDKINSSNMYLLYGLKSKQ